MKTYIDDEPMTLTPELIEQGRKARLEQVRQSKKISIKPRFDSSYRTTDEQVETYTTELSICHPGRTRDVQAA